VTVVEAIVGHERRLLAAALMAIPILCAAWIVPMARDMYGAMSGPSAWMMTPVWDVRHVTLLAAMWIVMMIGMMVPSAAPLLVLYAGVMRRGPAGPASPLRVYAMAGGYALVWIGFSLGAACVQRLGGRALLLSPMMTIASPAIAAAVLVVAALYQMTPLKRACLDACRSPVSFLTTHMRPGTIGAFRLGVAHGWYCLGCCWALMLLLFAGGVMNLFVVVALTAWVAVEKLTPFGAQSARISGALLLLAAGWVYLA
jgi:predicted metal-binding membrane protein